MSLGHTVGVDREVCWSKQLGQISRYVWRSNGWGRFGRFMCVGLSNGWGR